MFLEFGGMGMFDGHVPAVDRATQDRGLAEAMRALSAEGIVWAQDASVTLDELDVYLDGARDGAPPVASTPRSVSTRSGGPSNATASSTADVAPPTTLRPTISSRRTPSSSSPTA
jgi:hypothetical protein